MAKVWSYFLYPVFHQQLLKKLLCPITPLVQACRPFKVCWEVSELWRAPSEAAFIPAPPADITIAVTALALMSLCCVGCDVVTCKASAKSCRWAGTTIVTHSRGRALETRLEAQSCFQPCLSSRTAILHRSGPGGNISQQSWVLNISRVLILEENSAVQDGKNPQRTHTGHHGWIVSRPRLLSSPGTVAAGSWVSQR